ncbi:FAD-dependent oxidoreductase [Acidiphilium sp. AL]|nr:FAD-dependent oxidoreductase [Acidiphilium sp. AL]
MVVLGASHAAVHLAASAREAGYAEPILLLGAEAHPPYQRPPLSKGYLIGKVPDAALPLRNDTFYRDNKIVLALGAPAIKLDRQAREVETADGRRHRFDRLAFATGGRSRLLAIPGHDLVGVYVLRSLDDARRLRTGLVTARNAVVIGGGYIGLEIAACLASLGVAVTVLEAAANLLTRTASQPLATFLADAHRSRGVTIRLGVSARALRGESGRVRIVECTDGVNHPADLVICGIGAVPNVELAQAAGLKCAGGAIAVDVCGRTSEPEVVAAGDCACTMVNGVPLRLESIQNATDQAKAAGAAIVGRSSLKSAIPWFWSDQYDLKLQMAGLAASHDSYVLRGHPKSERFALFYYRTGRLLAVDTVNRPGEHLTARKLLALGTPVPPTLAADEAIDLRSLLDATPGL